MSLKRLSLGRRGEDLAAAYLSEKGYLIVARNYRCASGEIDLVAQHGPTLVFVEVKARRSLRYGPPEESLTRRKQAHLLASAQTYLQEHALDDCAWRVDVIAVELDGQGDVRRLEQIENAVALS